MGIVHWPIASKLLIQSNFSHLDLIGLGSYKQNQKEKLIKCHLFQQNNMSNNIRILGWTTKGHNNWEYKEIAGTWSLLPSTAARVQEPKFPMSLNFTSLYKQHLLLTLSYLSLSLHIQIGNYLFYLLYLDLIILIPYSWSNLIRSLLKLLLPSLINLKSISAVVFSCVATLMHNGITLRAWHT